MMEGDQADTASDRAPPLIVGLAKMPGPGGLEVITPIATSRMTETIMPRRGIESSVLAGVTALTLQGAPAEPR